MTWCFTQFGSTPAGTLPEVAAGLGYEQVYLRTPNVVVDLERLGWSQCYQVEADGESAVIVCKLLKVADPA